MLHECLPAFQEQHHVGCSSVVRNFRCTATLTAMQLGASLVRAMLALGEAAQTAERQLDAESKKKGKVCCTLCLSLRALNQFRHLFTVREGEAVACKHGSQVLQ